MKEDKLMVSLEAQNSYISAEVMENIKKDVVEVLNKYVDFMDDLDISIQQSESEEEKEILLVISGHVLFHP